MARDVDDVIRAGLRARIDLGAEFSPVSSYAVALAHRLLLSAPTRSDRVTRA